jgi:DNA invertase Pin-like site-specific DNA recombinase
MMLNLKGAMNENNRKEIGRRVRNKMELLAKSGRPAGGRAYGYIPASQSGTGQIEINEQQAQVVRQRQLPLTVSRGPGSPPHCGLGDFVPPSVV